MYKIKSDSTPLKTFTTSKLEYLYKKLSSQDHDEKLALAWYNTIFERDDEEYSGIMVIVLLDELGKEILSRIATGKYMLIRRLP